jgi:2-oxoglutarate dehydrogenase E1 component
MSPKSLLRHPLATSRVDELIEGRFHDVLDDPKQPAEPRRLIFCSGKVYYDLFARRDKEGIDDVALVRVEQFYPFDRASIEAAAKQYAAAEEICWVQEESKNRGGWTFMQPRLIELFSEHRIRYIGRGASASPATGSLRLHREEQAKIVEDALIR